MKKKQGFTLVELLVVIAIIAMLVTLLLPAVQAAREAARRTNCKNSLKQLGLALLNFESTNMHFPLGLYASEDASDFDDGYGWATKLLPFLEEQAVYDRISKVPGQEDIDPWATPGIIGSVRGVIPGGETSMEVFNCPSSSLPPISKVSATRGYAKSDFKASTGFGDFGLFWKPNDGARVRRKTEIGIKDVTDGTSKTLAFGESAYYKNPARFPLWIGATDRNGGSDEIVLFKTQLPSVINCQVRRKVLDPGVSQPVDDDCAFSWHDGGAQFSFADGSVHFIEESIEWETYQNLGDRRDGQPLGDY